jgi:hypothetical protein
MKNVTISLPDHVALQARIWAAEADTSVSQFLGGMLAERMERESGYVQATRNFLNREPSHLNDSGRAYPQREELHDRSGLR